MQALEVGDLGLVSGVDQRLEAGLDERADAAAEHGLLAEEVRLRLFLERRHEHARARRADRPCLRQRERQRLARRVLLDGDQRRRAAAFDEQLADAMPGRLRRDHRDVDVLRQLDRA